MTDKPWRLFHFDIKTLGNYGDTILFEAVRQSFHAYADRKKFSFGGSINLREVVGPRLVSALNDNYDAVVIGGGGLFLSDTNPNERSGWQWNCSIEMLKRIKKPLIIFAVGNNRFPGQPDFSPKFREHLNLVVQKSAFFGLRNKGSVATIREYLSPELRSKVVYQPCPTTILKTLMPDLYKPSLENPRTAIWQALVGKRQLAAGFQKADIYDECAKAIRILMAKGWGNRVFANARGDKAFHVELLERGLRVPLLELFGDRDIFNPLRTFADSPLTIGMRGHAQMVPFGLGNPVLSLFVHDKLRYFLEDIGFPELCIDVKKKRFADEIVQKAESVAGDFGNIRRKLALVQDELVKVTAKNLADIDRALGGSGEQKGFSPYSLFERDVSRWLYQASLDKESLQAELRKQGKKTAA